MSDPIINDLKRAFGIIGEKIGILCTATLGDTYITCSFMKAFAEETKKIPVLLIRKTHEDIVKMFEGGKIEYIIVEQDKLLALYEYIKQKNIIDYSKGIDQRESFLFGNLGMVPANCISEDVHFPKEASHVIRQYRTAVLGLSRHAQMRKPDNVFQIDEKYYIEKYGIIPNKTYILCPEATTPFFIPSPYLWDFLANFLRAQGYRVLFNITWIDKKMGYAYDGEVIDMPLRDVIGVINLCGNCISLRSGICDIMNTCDANITVLYLKLDGVETHRPERWSLKTMWDTKNVKEMTVDLSHLMRDGVLLSESIQQ